MRILSLSGDTGSTLVVAKALAEEWRASGHQVHVVAPVERFSWKLFAHVMKHRYELIHAHLGDAAILARRLGRLYGIPVVATLHGFQKAKHYQKIDYFTAVSEAVKAHYVKEGLPADKIDVIYNGYPLTLSTRPEATFREQLGLPKDALVIGNMATLTPVKQQHLIIEAATQLKVEFPNLHLLLAGSGPLEEPLKVQAQRAGFAKRVHFLGYTVARTAFYHALNLYVQASREEGFCMPIVEAMACSLPVISTQSGGPEEYLRDGENAWLVKEQTAQALADAIRYGLTHQEEAQRIGSEASEHVSSWGWRSIAKQYEKKLQEVIRCYHD